MNHSCISFRLEASGKPAAWEFERGGKRFNLAVRGPVTVNSIGSRLDHICEFAAPDWFPSGD